MKKARTTLTIDKDLLEKAKQHIPNLSEFIERCLEQYLGYVNGLYPTAKASDIIQDISKSQAELFILNESFDVHEEMKLIENEKINRPFRALWNDYKRRLKPNQELMQDVLKVVDIDEDTLEDVLDYAYVNMDSFSLNFSWEEVYSRYQQEEMKQ